MLDHIVLSYDFLSSEVTRNTIQIFKLKTKVRIVKTYPVVREPDLLNVGELLKIDKTSQIPI